MTDARRSVATAALRLAFSILVPGSGVIVASFTDLANGLFDAKTSRDKRKQITRLLEDVEDKISDRVEAVDLTFRSLPEGERTQACEAVSSTLTVADLSLAAIAEMRFDAVRLCERLLPTLSNELSERQISEPVRHYANTMLRFIAGDIVAIAKTMPGGERELLLRTLADLAKNPDRLTDAINRNILPGLRRGTNEEAASFETQYLNSLLATFGELKQFGLRSVPAAFQWQPLDVTYISISATPAASTESIRAGSYWQDHPTLSGNSRPNLSVEAVIGNLLNDTATSTREEGRQKRGMRLGIIGGAGSGKTTIVQWLASQCARSCGGERSLPADIRALRRHIPFVVVLRALEDIRLGIGGANLDELLTSVPGAGSPPGDWIESTLRSGQAVIFFDGIDEIAESSRGALWSWINAISARYPALHIVVTSRPEGMDSAVLGRSEFRLVQLLPLSPTQKRTCASRWYDAMLAGAPSNRLPQLRRAREILDNDLADNHSVRNMAETPLIVALLCAYYAAGHSGAPVSRAALIGEVCKVLVHQREEERGSIPRAFNRYALEHKMDLLGVMARFLFEKGSSIVSLEGGFVSLDSLTNVSSYLDEAVRENLPTPVLATYLAQRSIVFARVGRNHAQFVHRSFLEYAGAYSYANTEDGERALLRPADDRLWRELAGWTNVVAYYCSIAPQHNGRRILTRLLALVSTESDPHLRRQLVFCVCECASLVRNYDEETRSQITTLIRDALPPRSPDEVALFASFSGTLIQVMPEPRNLDEARLMIMTGARVGGSSGLKLIESVTATTYSSALVGQLVDAWDAFEPQLYVDRVLSHCPGLGSRQIEVGDTERLRVLASIPGVRDVCLRGVSLAQSVGLLAQLDDLVSLDLTNCRGETTLQGISALAGLRRLRLPKGGFDGDLREASKLLELNELVIPSANLVGSLVPLSELTNLRSLWIDKASATVVNDLSAVAGKLKMMGIAPSEECDWRHLSGMRELETLRLRLSKRQVNLEYVSACEGLRTLDIESRVARNAVRIPEYGQLLRLRLSGLTVISNLNAVSGHRNLREISLAAGCASITDLSIFRRCTQLRSLSVYGAVSLFSLLGINDLVSLRDLAVTESALGTLESDDYRPSLHGSRAREDRWSISTLQQLQSLNLDSSSQLSDVRALSRMKALETVSLRGVRHEVVQDALSMAFDVEYDDPWEFRPEDQNTG